MKIFIKSIAIFSFTLLFGTSLLAQEELAMFDNINEEEQKSIDALVMYPEETRMAILEVAQHPALLIKIDKLQSQSSAAFRGLVAPFSRDKQEAIWDLTRYPDLVPQLVALGPKKKKDAKALIKSYPDIIYDRALDIYKDEYQTLSDMEALRQETDQASKAILADYPKETGSAMQYLLDMPDVLSLLNEHIDLTILVGEVYQKYPDWLLEKADSLQQEIAAQQAEELEEWKKTLEENPEAREELEASAKDYAKEYGYDDLYYSGDDIYMDYEESEPREVVVRHQYYYNYPYWYSYPYWYTYPRWRPMPWWHSWGFYYSSPGSIVVVNLPSYYILDWYFYYPHHHYYYPRLTASCVNHYYRHRYKSRSSVTVNVRRWQRRNETVLTDNYLQDKNRQVKRIKEFGKMETDRLNYNRKYPSRSISQTEYVKKNKNKYPEVRAVKRSSKVTAPATKRDPVQRKEKIWIREKENIRTQPQKPTQRPKPNWDNNRIYKQPNIQRDQIKKDQRTIRKVDKARDYHKDRWTQPRKPAVRNKPNIRPKAAPRPAPKRTHPSKVPTQRSKN